MERGVWGSLGRLYLRGVASHLSVTGEAAAAAGSILGLTRTLLDSEARVAPFSCHAPCRRWLTPRSQPLQQDDPPIVLRAPQCHCKTRRAVHDDSQERDPGLAMGFHNRCPGSVTGGRARVRCANGARVGNSEGFNRLRRHFVTVSLSTWFAARLSNEGPRIPRRSICPAFAPTSCKPLHLTRFSLACS